VGKAGISFIVVPDSFCVRVFYGRVRRFLAGSFEYIDEHQHQLHNELFDGQQREFLHSQCQCHCSFAD
jgi:hypothetical protein